MNYFLWISNLGVVPLFLFAAFLFLPIFLSLFFLIVLVCCVFDAMLTTPAIIAQFNLIKKLYVYSAKPVVKIFVLFCIATPSYSSSKLPKTQTFFLSKGEQKEISINGIQKFSIGNKEVLGHKYLKLRKVLRLKGSKVGFSDLHVWLKNNTRQRFHFYVLSKREFLKNVQIADYLKSLGLSTSIEGEIIKVQGSLETQSQYKTLHQIIKSIPQQKIQFDVSLSSQLKKEIVSNIYQELITYGVTDIRCKLNKIFITCFYSENEKTKEIIKHLAQDTFTKFILVPNSDEFKNFEIELNVVAVSYSNDKTRLSGLHQIDTVVNNIVENKLDGAFGSNSIQLKDIIVQISTLARPQAMTTLGKQLELSLGEQRQFIQTLSDNVQTTEWKFAGLKLKFKIERVGNKLFASYENEFTTPGVGKIEGSKEQGHYLLKLGKAQKVFKIGLSSHFKSKKSLPFLSSIPVIGNLFKGNHKQSQYKEIYGHITVREQNGKI